MCDSDGSNSENVAPVAGVSKGSKVAAGSLNLRQDARLALARLRKAVLKSRVSYETERRGNSHCGRGTAGSTRIGGARGNPGPGSRSRRRPLADDHEVVSEVSAFLGTTTNNVAE